MSSSEQGIRTRTLIIPLGLTLVATLVVLAGGEASAWLRYERAAVLDGQWWRLLTDHFVHLGVPHLVMNLAGLWVVWLLVGACWDLLEWTIVVVVAALGVSSGLLILNPGLAWYVGLSGLLHGMLAGGAVAMAAGRDRVGFVLLAGLCGKLAWEQLFGALPGSAELAHGAVIVNAHLYGAAAGALTALILLGTRRHRRTSPELVRAQR